jgi:SAM-dependent methyltransferase
MVAITPMSSTSSADTASSHPSGADARPLARWEALSTVSITGAVVMLVEIMGTRIIGPVYGVSLFVWAALLSVTLCALAGGYYWGGVLIDRTPTRAQLGRAVSIGGVALGAVPMVAPPVLQAMGALGPRLGPLLVALIAFAPSLVALGMAGPMVVRLASTNVESSGRRVGYVYAVSTAGSLAGTLLTSFWLIPEVETYTIVLGGSVLLIALGALLLGQRRGSRAAVLLAVPLLASFSPKPSLPDHLRIVARESSLYGLVEVIDDASRGVRYLRSDHSIIGAHWLEGGSAAFAFLHAAEVLPFLRPGARDLLVIGLGTGALPTALAKTGVRADVVEIDPAVARYAERYFGFAPVGETHIEDARTFLRNAHETYDLIVHDTFTGGATPEHLLSVEVVRQLHTMLRPGGVLALNMVGFEHGPRAQATWAVLRTLRAEFPTVRAFRDSPLQRRPDETTNITFFASDRPLDFTIPADARFNDAYCAKILPALHGWEILGDVPSGELITDARNPLGRLQLAVAEAHYEAMAKLLPPQVWQP